MPRWIAVALLLVCPLLARADLKQYIDEQTLLAAEADLTKVNPALLEQWIRQTLDAAGMTSGKSPVLTPQETAQFIGHLNSWLLEVSRAGGKQIYVITHLGLIRDGGVAIIIPAAPGGDANKLAALLYSGKPTGPTSQPAGGRNPRAERYALGAEVLNGNVAVFGTTNARAYARTLKPAARPDLEAALKSSGGAAVKVAVAPTQMVRAVMSGAMQEPIFDQPSAALTQGLQWLAVGATLPPTVSLKVIAQASNADAAKQLHHIATHGLAAASGVPPQISPDMAKLLTPTLTNDQLVLSADNDKLVALAKELVPKIREARRHALVVKSMSNMRQILTACHMHAADNKGRWPDDLKGLEKYIKTPQVFSNPNHPDLKPAYIYIKPKNPRNNTSQTMVLYESHKEFGAGVGVGFLDGHAEYVSDKNRFDELLAQTEAH